MANSKYNKDYVINNIKISYPSYIDKKNEDGSDKIFSNQEKLGILIDETKNKAYNNLSRMKKLSDEYKASQTYNLTKSEKENNSNIDLSDNFYTELSSKFYNASSSIRLINDLLSSKNINTDDTKNIVKLSIESLEVLRKFTHENLHKTNSSFENSFYDTSSESFAAGFTMILFFPIALFAQASNTHNTNFDGKIDRAIEESTSIENNLNQIGEMLYFYETVIS